MASFVWNMPSQTLLEMCVQGQRFLVSPLLTLQGSRRGQGRAWLLEDVKEKCQFCSWVFPHPLVGIPPGSHIWGLAGD